jgi:long-chain acyl-CoA synthetase
MIEQSASLVELFHSRVRVSSDLEALKSKKNGQWSPVTWKEYSEHVLSIAKGILSWTKPGDRICLLSESRPEWVFSDFAILSLGCVSVPIYPTLPIHDLALILEEVEAEIIFVSNLDHLHKLLTLRRQGRLDYLKRIICFELSIHCDGESIFSLEQIKKEAGSVSNEGVRERSIQLKKSILATIIYTSGTTGKPKGAMLTHGNILANLDGLAELTSSADLELPQMLSFLPLSHAFERTLGHFWPVKMGYKVAYAESYATLKQDFLDVKPNILIGVPKIYEQVYSRAIQGIRTSGLPDKLIEWCLLMGQKKAMFHVSKRDPGFLFQTQYEIADRILFRKVRHQLGNQLLWAISGGAPLSKKIQEFFIGAGICMLEGYGLSETSPALTATPPDEIRLGSVGRPLWNVEMKIDNVDGNGGEGEVLAKGPSIMKGYYQQSAETSSVFTQDGWFRTGDIGYFDQDGFLFLTDRKKELIKTTSGKYVAPQASIRFINDLLKKKKYFSLLKEIPFNF